jgi:hypothetical protein
VRRGARRDSAGSDGSDPWDFRLGVTSSLRVRCLYLVMAATETRKGEAERAVVKVITADDGDVSCLGA